MGFLKGAGVLLVAALLVTWACPARTAGELQPGNIPYRKSWISIEPPDPTLVIKVGAPFQVRVRYYLDPADAGSDGARLVVTPLGPWIDNPDGKYTTTRHHVDYPGLSTRVTQVHPGAGEQDFSFRADRVYRYNGLLFVATFQSADGKNWPWETRAAGPTFSYEEPYYQLSNGRPGGLFTYEEPVKLEIVFKDGAIKGEKKTLSYQVVDTSGAVVDSGERPLTVGGVGESVEITPSVKRRGTFVLEASVPGWGSREVVFARIPDVMKLTGGAATQFAATNLHTDAECRAARMLGFTACREFMDWRAVQPGRDTWDFTDWDRILATTRRHGIEPWLCITTPPNWVLDCPPTNIGYEPFPFDAAAWRQSADTMTRRWKDRISGWEWLNEIVPGSVSSDPVQDYLRFCAIGTETVRKIKPSLRTILAGGLWPRTFRNDLLRAGVGKLIDELPVHYSDMEGVLDARDDLDAAGCRNVVVTDDESSSGLSTWEMPTREMLQVKSQSQWVLDRWPDELVAGARRITCFAGWTDPCGNWSYLLDEHTPRPMAATIAVLTSKLAGARPVGKFYLSGNAVFTLFEKGGKAVLLASAPAPGQTIHLNEGSPRVVVTDYQGNETVQQTPGGKLAMKLDPMPVFIEGGSLAVLQSYCAVSVGDSRRIVAFPRSTVIQGSTSTIPVTVTNRYARMLVGSVSIAGPIGWPHSRPVRFSVAPGSDEQLKIPLALPTAIVPGEAALEAAFTFKNSAIPQVIKPFGVSVISREMVGSLLKNGGFEEAGSSETVPAGWSLGSPTTRRDPSGGGLGLGNWVLKFSSAAGYEDASQTISPPPGHTYLYTAWIWNHDMMAGSNIGQAFTDGTRKDFYTPQVFMSANSSPSWRFYACTTDTPPNLKSISFTPVVKGPGWALFDNVRVTLFEGSKYAAECHRAKAPLRLDGSLNGWDTSCPIPLLCDNQLSRFDPSYRWTPDNLSGVAYLMWDEKALYVTVQAIDDVHFANTTGERTLEGDSVALAIHPANRAPGQDQKAFVYYLSSASPGGGSGAHTLYRPPAHSGGLASGQLAKDSSVYELLIRTQGKKTVYQARLPWSELGGIVPAFGSKFGLSLMLNDSDGSGRAASMSWGDGLATGWSPANFGVATLVGP